MAPGAPAGGVHHEAGDRAGGAFGEVDVCLGGSVAARATRAVRRHTSLEGELLPRWHAELEDLGLSPTLVTEGLDVAAQTRQPLPGRLSRRSGAAWWPSWSARIRCCRGGRCSPGGMWWWPPALRCLVVSRASWTGWWPRCWPRLRWSRCWRWRGNGAGVCHRGDATAVTWAGNGRLRGHRRGNFASGVGGGS